MSNTIHISQVSLVLKECPYFDGYDSNGIEKIGIYYRLFVHLNDKVFVHPIYADYHKMYCLELKIRERGLINLDNWVPLKLNDF
ncbi:hypothetical protein FPV63_12455 [Vibrio cholerae]|nr:hypothetical protein FPV63_12455 [Vibrio cholerae]